MDKYRSQKKIYTHFWFPLITLTLLAACHSIPTLDELDEVAIYSAVIRQIYTRNDTFGGTLPASTVEILQAADDSVGDSNTDQAKPRNRTEVPQTEITA